MTASLLSLCRHYHLPYILLALVIALLLRQQQPDYEPTKRKKTSAADIIANLTRDSPHNIGEVCNTDNDCFNVIQSFGHYPDGRLYSTRQLQFRARGDLALSIAEMSIPKAITKYYANPKNWKVNHRVLFSAYNALHSAAGFAIESLRWDIPDRQDVLMVGMGGGSAGSFLATLNLNLDITVIELEESIARVAKEYFDFRETSKVRVIIGDGAEYVQKAAEQGRIFHSILLDACSNNVKRSMLCPAPIFIEDDIIASFSKAVGSVGVVSLNLFSVRDVGHNEDKVLTAYSKHFTSCFNVYYQQHRQMLICSNKPEWTWHERRAEIIKNVEEFDRRAKTHLALALNHFNK